MSTRRALCKWQVGKRGRATIGVALLAALAPANPATACSFHVETSGGFETAYPGSLATAVAVGQAKLSGQLPAVELREGVLGYWQTTRMLERLGAGLTGTSEAEAPEFSLLLVEQRLWTEYKSNPPGGAHPYAVAVHAAAPKPGSTAVLTALPVLSALLEYRMSPREALDANLLKVVGADREAVLDVLSRSDISRASDQ